MKRFIILFSLSVAGIVAMFVIAAKNRAAGITVERGIVFGKGGDTELKLDLAMPQSGDGPFPALVFVPGAGWRTGSRQDMNHFIEGVAHLGFVGVTPDYRLVPTARFPAQIEDCKAAVRWLRANAAKYRVRSDRIGVIGFSGGGHLACMLGVTAPADGLEGAGGNSDQSSAVQAVVSFFAPTDFSTHDWPKDLDTEVIIPFLGGTAAEQPEAYRRASPISFISKNTPPFLLFHGTSDKLIPIDQSKRLAERLKSFGVPVQLVILEGENHGFSDANNQKCMQQMLDFLNERLKK
jgi:acetyl esterase/lipase